jgi:hypothetical protein
MATPRPRRQSLACVLIAAGAAALAAGALNAVDIAVVPQAQAAGAGDDAQAVAGGSWCSSIPPGYAHPPANGTPLTLQLLQPSVEPVPATDGLIHLPYVAQVTNTQPTAVTIVGVVPVDPLANFSPTGRNLITNEQGNDVAGKVAPFAPGGVPPEDGVGADTAQPVPGFSSRVPAVNAGLMYFDVTYTDPTRVPRLLAHAITVSPDGSGPGAPGLTNPVPVGCKTLAVLRPPLVGHGWSAFNGCCTVAAYHRDAVLPINGLLQAGEQFAIDFNQLGPDNTCCNGPPQVPSSWFGYGTPVLAAAPGVVVSVVDGLPDQQPVGTIAMNFPAANAPGNGIVEDIGGGRYVGYAHFKPGSIPTEVRPGARLRAGDLIGRVGNSGNSAAPHLHFQVADAPSLSFLDATGLPFVFDTQLLEGTVPTQDSVQATQAVELAWLGGGPLPVDRAGAGVVRSEQMPARNGVFGYNLSSPPPVHPRRAP